MPKIRWSAYRLATRFALRPKIFMQHAAPMQHLRYGRSIRGALLAALILTVQSGCSERSSEVRNPAAQAAIVTSGNEPASRAGEDRTALVRQSQGILGEGSVDSVASFAREFYAWYTSEALTSTGASSVKIALQNRPHLLAPDLAAMLKSDIARQDSLPGIIVGIDFDPFLGSQDPCDEYVVGNVTKTAAAYLVEVDGNCGDPDYKPDLTARIVRLDGRFVIWDVTYPHGDGLRDTLRSLAEMSEASQ